MIAVFGDLHLKANEKFGNYDITKRINTRTQDKLNMLSNAIGNCKINGVTDIFFLGDVFTSLNPGEKVKSLFFYILAGAINSGIKVWIILGNHDYNTVDLHTFMTAESLSINNLEIIKGPTRVDIEGKSITMLPYKCSLEAFDKTDVLFSHGEIEGYYPEPNISLEQAAHFDIILNGHYHDKDKFHAGSFCVYTRSEIGKEHGYYLIDNWEVKFVPVKDRLFIKIDCTVDEIKDMIAKNEFTEDTVLSLKILDTKENLKAVSVYDIKKLIPDIHKVVIDKKEITDTKIITAVDSGSYDLKQDIKVYSKEKDPKMEKHGIKILEISQC